MSDKIFELNCIFPFSLKFPQHFIASSSFTGNREVRFSTSLKDAADREVTPSPHLDISNQAHNAFSPGNESMKSESVRNFFEVAISERLFTTLFLIEGFTTWSSAEI